MPDRVSTRVRDYAFVYGDFRRLHRIGLIACHYRAAEWRHKEIELAAHELLSTSTTSLSLRARGVRGSSRSRTSRPTPGLSSRSRRSAVCREVDLLYLLDACQSVSQYPLDVSALGCDFMSATCRKFLRGPRGSGLLFVSDRALEAGLEPLFIDMRGGRGEAGRVGHADARRVLVPARARQAAHDRGRASRDERVRARLDPIVDGLRDVGAAGA